MPLLTCVVTALMKPLLVVVSGAEGVALSVYLIVPVVALKLAIGVAPVPTDLCRRMSSSPPVWFTVAMPPRMLASTRPPLMLTVSVTVFDRSMPPTIVPVVLLMVFGPAAVEMLMPQVDPWIRPELVIVPTAAVVLWMPVAGSSTERPAMMVPLLVMLPLKVNASMLMPIATLPSAAIKPALVIPPLKVVPNI